MESILEPVVLAIFITGVMWKLAFFAGSIMDMMLKPVYFAGSIMGIMLEPVFFASSIMGMMLEIAFCASVMFGLMFNISLIMRNNDLQFRRSWQQKVILSMAISCCGK